MNTNCYLLYFMVMYVTFGFMLCAFIRQSEGLRKVKHRLIWLLFFLKSRVVFVYVFLSLGAFAAFSLFVFNNTATFSPPGIHQVE